MLLTSKYGGITLKNYFDKNFNNKNVEKNFTINE